MRSWEVDDKVNYYWHYNKWGKMKYKSGQASCIGWWWCSRVWNECPSEGSQSQRRALLGPSSGWWKHLQALSQIKTQC